MPETFTLSQTESLADGSTVTNTLTITTPDSDSQKPYDQATDTSFAPVNPAYLTFRYNGAWRTVKDYKVDFNKGLLTAFECTKNWEISNQIKSYKLSSIESCSDPDVLTPPASTDNIVSFYYDGLLREVVNPDIICGAYQRGQGTYNALLAGFEVTRDHEPTNQFKKYLLSKIEAVED
jgi:hypothetical protein